MKFTASFLALLVASQAVSAFPFRSVETQGSLAPVPVTELVCDGDSYKCTADLDFGDGRWVAQWNAAVFHTGLFGAPDHKETMATMAMAPVPITKALCDGNAHECTANLNFGDGRWVARWSTNFFHQGFKSGASIQMVTATRKRSDFIVSQSSEFFASVPMTRLVCDGESYKCTADLKFGDDRWVAQWDTNVFHSSNFLDEN